MNTSCIPRHNLTGRYSDNGEFGPSVSTNVFPGREGSHCGLIVVDVIVATALVGTLTDPSGDVILVQSEPPSAA